MFHYETQIESNIVGDQMVNHTVRDGADGKNCYDGPEGFRSPG